MTFPGDSEHSGDPYFWQLVTHAGHVIRLEALSFFDTEPDRSEHMTVVAIACDTCGLPIAAYGRDGEWTPFEFGDDEDDEDADELIFRPNLKPTEALPCGCANDHMWFTVGALPELLMETRFDDPDGRWCPLCGEPDRYCVKEFGLQKRDPDTIGISYALVIDSGGTVYVDRRLPGAAAQES